MVHSPRVLSILGSSSNGTLSRDSKSSLSIFHSRLTEPTFAPILIFIWEEAEGKAILCAESCISSLWFRMLFSKVPAFGVWSSCDHNTLPSFVLVGWVCSQSVRMGGAGQLVVPIDGSRATSLCTNTRHGAKGCLLTGITPGPRHRLQPLLHTVWRNTERT